jgi:hypothetical protein
LRRAEGGAKVVGVFRVKNHDFTPKNHIFSNCEGRRENFWGISCEKSRFTQKNHIFSNIRGGGVRRVRPPLDLPLITPWTYLHNTMDKTDIAHASNQYVEKLNIVLKTLRKQQI